MHENDETMNANDETNKGCVGIWGWNTIPVLCLVAIVGWTLYTVATQHFPAFFDGLMWALWDEGSDAYNYPLGVCIAGELAANLVLATLGAYALRLLFKRSASYPALATWVMVGAAFVAGLNCVITRHFGMEVSAKEEQEVFCGAIFALIWLCYLAKSEKIRNTFVNARASWPKVWMVVALVLAAAAFCGWKGLKNPPAVADGEEAQAASEAPKTYICILEVQEDEDGAEMELEELEARIRAAMAKRGIDDVAVGLTDDEDVVLGYSNAQMIPDELVQELIDLLELPIALEVIEQREYIPE